MPGSGDGFGVLRMLGEKAPPKRRSKGKKASKRERERRPVHADLPGVALAVLVELAIGHGAGAHRRGLGRALLLWIRHGAISLFK